MHNNKPILLTALVAASLLIGCSSAPAQPAATETPAPTATAVPTPEPTPVFSAPYFGTAYAPDAESITVTGPVSESELSEIESALPLFPGLKTLTFTDASLPKDTAARIRTRHPALALHYPVVFLGKTCPVDTREPEIGAAFPAIGDLIDGLSVFSQPESLDLHGHPYSDEELMQLRAAYPSVRFRYTVTMLGKEYESDTESIDLTGTAIKKPQMEELYAKLGLFTGLKFVDMSKCGPKDEEMDALNKAFPDIKIVWMVKLRGAKTWWIRTDAKSFSTALASNPKKQLWSRDVQPLIYCTELEGLDLGHNEVRELDFLHYLPKLKYLILVGCGIKDITPIGELKDLEYLEIFANDITDITPLANCTKLVDVNIANTDIADLSPLYGLKNLQRVWASRCKFPEEQKQEIQEKLPNCTFDFLAWSPTGNGWRKHPNFFKMREFFGLGIID
ncbi:MAG: hypothetical protein Q4C53_02365 [Clostridia bacterium]|nr:hypothetical protein [Clostridia bacterium]